MALEQLAQEAITFGFTRAAGLDVRKLKMSGAAEVRALCEANACGNYGRNWRCPPAVGPVEACVNEVLRYREGLVVQYVGEMEDSFDFEATGRALTVFRQLLLDYSGKLSGWDDILSLGAGGCILCENCTCPDAPCLHPQFAYASVEGYGINVMRLCRQAGLPYHSGPNTVTYTGLYLLEKGENDGVL